MTDPPSAIRESPGDELKRVTTQVLESDCPPGILSDRVGALTQILENAASFRIAPGSDIAHGETPSADGLALSPTQAAMCAGDFLRTAVFLRGVHRAIEDRVATNPTEPVRVLYAGSGPYGTLAVPLMSLFPAGAVQFTILDIHETSIESVRSAIANLGFDSCVTSFETVDACGYTIPTDQVPDIVLSETMNAALEKEPQVAIMRHLIAQAPGAVMIPENVRIDACLLDPSKEFTPVEAENEGPQPVPARDRVHLGTVFELNAERIRSWSELSDERLPAATIQFPSPIDERYQPFLLTTIEVREEHVLNTYDSGLTVPRTFSLADGPVAGKAVAFHYRLANPPGLECQTTAAGENVTRK